MSFFENAKGLKGEVTPSYSILDIEDIQKMYRLAPDAKLILLLRNPIYRAWSNYLHLRRKSKELKNRKIDIEHAIQFMDSPHQTRRSDYEQTIKNYLSVYSKSQLLVGFYDSLSENPLQLIENVVEFIGGNSEHISEYLDVHQRFNSKKKIEMPEEIFEFLKEKYRAPIERLASKYGGYFGVWLEEVYSVKNEKEVMLPVTLRF